MRRNVEIVASQKVDRFILLEQAQRREMLAHRSARIVYSSTTSEILAFATTNLRQIEQLILDQIMHSTHSRQYQQSVHQFNH